ncbi:hypothetical protein [Salinithrix halophila]|uniref:UDP-N-acetylmuramyl pentapeptide phosphotransferase/UDP-N-acetylglucosamine-1-phosphate transferase n=1 Tax=Salinithrix halophila TaxID=1485204 RepID=A0ABV8JGR2_9BACL
MTGIWSLLLLFLSYIAGRAAIPAGREFLFTHGVHAPNYRGERIPTSFGGYLVLLLTGLSLLNFAVIRFLPLFSQSLLLASLFASVGVAFLGWLDDTLGSHQDRGFRGHFRSMLREGRLTTGVLKAAGGGITAAVAAVVTAGSGMEWVIHTLFIALMTNWLNLLDLRPGRCLKFYLAGGILLYIVGFFAPNTPVFVPLLGLAAAIFRLDLAGRLMLGDSGANLLGLQLGMWAAVVLPFWLTGVLTILLGIGHYLSETVSLTRIIESNRWLSYLDGLGRRGVK